MKGDFTRNTFDKNKHLLRVLMQQGRVQLDADWNEQVSIFWHYLQTLAEDLIGSHGGVADSFKIESLIDNQLNSYNFSVKAGHYYVNGILCENSKTINYKEQQGFLSLQPDQKQDKIYLVYLDVWERHITYIEDANIREVALGGPDTATRTKVVWQVKTQELKSSTNCGDINPSWSQLTEQWQPKNRGLLKAKAKVGETTDSSDPCIIDPTASYRGAENQLYRVEIHTGGTDKTATFKWSRENGSVVFPIRQLSGTIVTLEHLGRDSRFSLKEGDWVEIVDDDYVLQNLAEPLLQVQKINSTDLEVTLNKASTYNVGKDPTKHPLLRRWDHRQGDLNKNYPKLSDTNNAAVIKEYTWLTLENGIQIWFKPGATYRTGDYWLIPARTATGDVEWPSSSESGLLPLPPHGVDHHYAKLAVISVDSSGQVTIVDDCRQEIGNPFNRVVNASWHHDQVFTSMAKNPVEFQSGDIYLANLFDTLGLVVQFRKPVRVDSLHNRSVFVLAQQTTNTGEVTNTVFPMLITPVQVGEVAPKSVNWLIGNDIVNDIVQDHFDLITVVRNEDPLTTVGDFTKAVKLCLFTEGRENFFNLLSSKSNVQLSLSVVLRGDWILNEEVLFEVSWKEFGNLPENSTRWGKLCTHFNENGFFLSPTATIYKEKEDRWRLMDGNKMYVVRQKEDKLTILATHALDGNNIWPSVPGCPSGNGTEGGDWISAIHIIYPSN